MGDNPTATDPGPTPASVRVDDAEAPAESRELNLRATLTMSFAHFSHDLYSSFVPVLIPPVQDKLGIPLAVVSLMSPAQQFPSILQPAVGVVADRTSRRWFVVLAPAVAAVSISLVGLAPHFGLILLLLLTSGLASAAFHPPAVTLTGQYGGRKTGQAMGWFMAGGQLSRMVGPLLITAAIAWFTLEGSFVVMVFGVAASVLLYLNLDTRSAEAGPREQNGTAFGPLLRGRAVWVGALIGVGLIRALSAVPFTIFLVKMLEEQGRSVWYAGFSLSVLSGAGVFGGFLGGWLSDRFGRRGILALTSIITPPLLYLYLWQEPRVVLALALLALGGLVIASLRPIQLAYIHEMVPESPGPAAGLVLAFQFVGQSIAAFAFGAFADAIGIVHAFWWAPPTALLALPLIALLPSADRVRAITYRSR